MMNKDIFSLQCRHNGCDSVSNHQPYDCLLNRLFRRRSKENIKAPCHWPLCGEFTGNRWIPPHKWPVTREGFPFDDFNLWYPNLCKITVWINTCVPSYQWDVIHVRKHGIYVIEKPVKYVQELGLLFVLSLTGYTNNTWWVHTKSYWR